MCVFVCFFFIFIINIFFNNFSFPRHFSFVVWLKYYNLRHFSLALVFKIVFFICVSSQYLKNLGKSMETKCRFRVQKYCHFHHLSLQQLGLQIPRLDNLPLACQEALHNKIVSDYHQIMNWMTSEIFVTMCAIKKFFFSVFWNLLHKFCFHNEKKMISKK